MYPVTQLGTLLLVAVTVTTLLLLAWIRALKFAKTVSNQSKYCNAESITAKALCELSADPPNYRSMIDVFRDNEGEVEEFDIDLDEFSDEIETWIIDELKRVGCDTARSVIDLTDEELERRTDLEKETIAEVKRVLNEEFKKE